MSPPARTALQAARSPRAAGWAFGLGLVTTVTSIGCANGPMVAANGLPVVARYASPAQMEWVLSRYQTLGQGQGQGQGTSSGPSAIDPDLREEICLGWERAIFDIESGRRYPMILRMAPDVTGMANLWQDLALLVRKHPRPDFCAETPARPPEGAQVAAAAGAAATTPAQAPSEAPVGEPATPPTDAVSRGPAIASAPAAAPVVALETPPPASATPIDTPAARHRRELTRLRNALGMTLTPTEVRGDPTEPELIHLPTPGLDPGALATLHELAQSEITPVRLRARYHLLGLCMLSVRDAELYEREPALGRQICSARPNESLRQAQGRMMWQMLSTWRAKPRDLEPLSGIVVALANSASRDNPLVDGPRATR